MNKIYVLFSLCLVVLFSSCDDAVFVTEPLPFSDRENVEILPEYISGNYEHSSCNSNSSLLKEVSKLSIRQENSMIYLNTTKLKTPLCNFKIDLSTNKLYLGKCGYNFGFVDGQDIKVFKRGEKIYFNTSLKFTDKWSFIIIEPMTGDRISVTLSTYNKRQFEEQKYNYESNENFFDTKNRGERGQYMDIIFDNVDDAKFVEILNDKKLLHSCIFKKQD